MNSDFENSLKQFRPIPFYFLNTTEPEYYTEDTVFSAMKKMKDFGFGGIVMFNKPPTGFDQTQYLSEFWFEVTGHFIHAAKKLDLQLWINDGFNFPPGDAAGRIEAADPTLKQLRLIPNQEGNLIIQEVPWGFPAFEEKESSELFIKFVYEEYYKRFSEFFGNGITGFFSDADNRRYNAHVVNDCPERYYPWSRNFSELFRNRYGYKIENHLKELFTQPEANVQKDYWELCGILYQNWFAGNHAWCKAHNVLYTFHTSDTGPIPYEKCRRSSAFSEGDPLELLSHSDCPGTDHEIYVLDGGTHYDARYYVPKVTLGGDSEHLEHPALNDTSMDIRAKYAQSAAVLNGKQRVMCEMFAATNHGISYNELQRIAAWQIIQGINFIIPHAVHHKFHGETKYFAPPEFSWTNMQHGLRQFNDRLAFWSMAAAEGEYLAEYAVADPTQKVWQGADPEAFFKLCDKLNRRAEGYIIVPPDYRNNSQILIDPLKQIPDLPPSKITFSGGDLAYMRRKIQGEEYLLAANIWNPNRVQGTLVFREKSYKIELEPGEIAIFGGPFESYRTPEEYQVKQIFSEKYPVTWKNQNLIPFDQELSFTTAGSQKILLYIPKNHPGTVEFNGNPICSSKTGNIFADDYLVAELEISEGINKIKAEIPAQFYLPFYLAGEFDAELQTKNDYAVKVYESYLLAIYEPEEKLYHLTPRSRSVFCDHWEKQGQLFYSGEAVLDLGKVNCGSDEKLLLPGFNGTAELLINGKPEKRLALAPYSFELPSGINHLSLRLWNTMANQMERYAACSGPSEKPVIITSK